MLVRILLPVAMACSVTACSFNGEPVLSGDSGHSINVGGDLDDSATLSLRVRNAIRNNAQTSLARIQVSAPSEDTVKLSGMVDNDATRYEAERVASGVAGVRFVVNNLNIRR